MHSGCPRRHSGQPQHAEWKREIVFLRISGEIRAAAAGPAPSVTRPRSRRWFIENLRFSILALDDTAILRTISAF